MAGDERFEFSCKPWCFLQLHLLTGNCTAYGFAQGIQEMEHIWQTGTSQPLKASLTNAFAPSLTNPDNPIALG